MVDKSEQMTPHFIEFTPEQWSASQEYLWDQAVQAGEIRDSIVPEIDGLYQSLTAKDSRILSARERKEQADQYERYWESQSQLQQLIERESALMTTLERIEDGEATPEEVMALLPQEEPKAEDKMSKRREAILKQQQRANQSQAEIDCGAFLLGLYGIVDSSPAYYPTTDPRRIASGRNLRKLIAGAGISTCEAESAFMEVTADTHGGKSRRPGKSGTHYVAASGKRVRKK